MKKVLISERVLQELSIKQNIKAAPSKVSTVYVGDKWVKKIKNKYDKTGKEYSKSEMQQFEIMEKHPDIFPITKIKEIKDKNGILQPIVLQKKVDITKQQGIYYSIQENMGELMYFREILEQIANRGVNEHMKKLIPIIESRLNGYLLKYFNQYIELATKLYNIRETEHLEYSADLHSGNFGLDGENIKVVDFLSPFLKTP